MMDALERLKSLMSSGSVQPLSRPWLADTSLDGHISKLEKHLQQSASTYVPRDLQEEAVKRFWTTTRLATFRDAHLVSHGVVLPVGPQRVKVIEDRERFPALLESVDKYLPAPRQYRRCYQGLLKGYFAYDFEARGIPEIGARNWESLRGYLTERSGRIIDGPRNPQWAEKLQEHAGVLGQDPCSRYGPALLSGQSEEVDELLDVFSVPDSSWFVRKMFLAQIQTGVKKADADFLGLLYRLIELIQDNELIRDEGLTLVLNRFANLKPPSLAIPLRDLAVASWGNPWLETNAMWRHPSVSSEAKAMVTEWLKLEFIEAFFTLLAEENTGDDRRLKFWARYVNTISDIRFALGTDAQTNRSPDFQKLRKKMAGLVVPLNDNVRANNAFIMRMGPLYIVEFSAYSNACYGYDARGSLPFRLDMPVVTPVDAKNSLKHSSKQLWLQHQDGIKGYQKWENRFAHELASKYGVHPKASPTHVVHLEPTARKEATSTSSSGSAPAPKPQATTESHQPFQSPPPLAVFSEMERWKSTKFTHATLSLFAAQFRLQLDDKTRDNGNLWVRTNDANAGINEVLKRWGFSYKNAARGWWHRGTE